LFQYLIYCLSKLINIKKFRSSHLLKLFLLLYLLLHSVCALRLFLKNWIRFYLCKLFKFPASISFFISYNILPNSFLFVKKGSTMKIVFNVNDLLCTKVKSNVALELVVNTSPSNFAALKLLIKLLVPYVSKPHQTHSRLYTCLHNPQHQ